MKIAINGFGRIGRLILRAAYRNKDFWRNNEIVAVNDLTSADTLGHLLKYDSIHRIFEAEVETKGSKLIVDGRSIEITSVKDPSQLPWAQMGVDIAVESTGLFAGVFSEKDKVPSKIGQPKASLHLQAGAKKVIVTAPSKKPDLTVVLGVNEKDFDPTKHNIISNASCTTNSMAPPLKIIQDKFGIEKGYMTTVHSYTNDQRILDLPHEDLRRARAAAMSIIPTTTGAAKAIGEVIPALKGKMDGLALRVPTPDGSITDMTLQLSKTATKEEINGVLKEASERQLRGIMEYTEEPIVMIDIIDNPHSAIIDGQCTNALGNLVKVFSWYDNEWGYSNRIVDLVDFIRLRMEGKAAEEATKQVMLARA